MFTKKATGKILLDFKAVYTAFFLDLPTSFLSFPLFLFLFTQNQCRLGKHHILLEKET